MSSPNENGAGQELIEAAIERMYPKPNAIGRRILKRLVGNSMRPRELCSDLWTEHKYRFEPGDVAKEITLIRNRIRAYYLSPIGFFDPLRIEIPILKRGGRYTIAVVENPPPRNAAGFWAGHLGNGKPTRIITGHPEFLQTKSGNIMFHNESFYG